MGISVDLERMIATSFNTDNGINNSVIDIHRLDSPVLQLITPSRLRKKRARGKKKVTKQCDYMTILLYGACKSGKTAVISRYMNNSYTAEYESTKSMEYYTTYSPDHSTCFSIWDTSGYKFTKKHAIDIHTDLDAVVVCVDLTNNASIKFVTDDIYILTPYISNPAVSVVLCGTKSDGYTEIRDGRMRNLRDRYKFYSYVKTSAKNDTGIDTLFKQLIALQHIKDHRD